MQVVCANCQLSFQAPEGAAGLMCPICRSPLKPPESAGTGTNGSTAPARQIVDWSGGSVDDLITLLSAPAWSARVEVFATGSDEPVGEVHVIAGGVSDALYLGSSTHHALEDLRAATAKGGRFRIEPRLPNPADGSLATSGPAQGKLDERPLATLMRYCEDFVLTCGIEVWRGSENAKVDYRRGEIVGVTVGGIDAPERLAEVMKWASGNYRLTVPVLDLPATAPVPAPATPVKTAGTPAAPRGTGSAANKTIFGMPAVDPATLAAPRVKAPTPPNGPVPATVEASPSAVVTTASKGLEKGPESAVDSAPSSGKSAPAPSPLPVAAAAATATSSASAPTTPSTPGATPPGRPNANNRTIFGVAAPNVPAPVGDAPTATATPAAAAAEASPAAPAAAAEATVPSKAAAPAKSGGGKGAAANKGAGKPGRAAVTTASAGAPTSATSATAASSQEEERTAPTRPAKEKPAAVAVETAVSTYVGVGFVIGLVLLGLYWAVMRLAN